MNKKGIPIFLSADNNYAPFVATTIASICDNTKSFCDFYVLDSGITNNNKESICKLKEQFNNFSIEFISIDPNKEFKTINYYNASNYITISTYNRFLIPQLKPELNKVLYLDVDIVVLGDIAELYAESLDGYALGAIWDNNRKYFNTDTKNLIELSDNYKYFNAGILIIDIQKWNNMNILESLFEIEKKYKEKILHADETILNKYFDNKYKILPIKYNYTDYDAKFNTLNNVIIRHFARKVKPWHIQPDTNSKFCPNTQEFWKYAKITPFYDELTSKCCNLNINKITRILRIEDMILKKRIALAKNKEKPKEVY